MVGEQSVQDTSRLLTLSDGVFAIAITVLVLNVDLPVEPAGTVVTWRMVLAEWRDVFSYVLSFLVVGNFWIDHRHVFSRVTRHTRAVTWLNIHLLMTVAFLPFPTALLGDYGGLVPVVFYAASMTTTGALLYALWWYVSRDESELVADVDVRRIRYYRFQYLLTPLSFGVSIPVALLLGPTFAFVCWASLFVSIPSLKRRFGVDESR